LPSHASPQLAINQAAANVTAGEVEILNILAERRETISHLAQTGRRLFALYSAIRKGNFKRLAPETYARYLELKKKGKVSPPLDIIADAWLEARYAWRPLIIDVESIWDHYKSQKGGNRRTYRASDYPEPVIEEGLTYSITDSSAQYDFTFSKRLVNTVRAGILTELDLDPRVGELGLLNIAGTAWEIVPFSFVVDWFIDISGIISSLNPEPRITPLASWYTSQSYVALSGTVTVTPSGSDSYTQVFNLVVTDWIRRKDTVATYFPSIDVNLDMFKLLDSFALLRRLVN